MAKNTKKTKEDPEVKIETAIDKTEQFLYDNGKVLLIALAVIILAIGGVMAYKYLYIPKQVEKASALMFVAEQNFAAESFETALNGDANHAGFLEVSDKYGKTPQGNLAAHYAGICYLNLGQYDDALKYLGKYDRTKGSPNEIVNAQNLGLQGDVYVQKQHYDKAAELYNKAVEASQNSLTAPYYLKKLGMVYEKLGRVNDAVEAYRSISDDYPASIEARDIDKYIGAAEQ